MHDWIRLTERGDPVVLSASQFPLELEEPLRLLEQAHVVKITTQDGYRLVQANQFVGSLSIHGSGLMIEPKRIDVFTALTSIRHLFGGKVPAASGAGGPYERRRDPSEAFIARLVDAVGTGLPAVYRRQAVWTSNPRGKLLFGESTRRWARSRIEVRTLHQVRALDGRFMSVIATAADIVHGAGRNSSLKLHSLDSLLDEWSESVVSLETAAQLAQDVRSDLETEEQVALLDTALALIRGHHEFWDLELITPYGVARFTDTEGLWEAATAHFLGVECNPSFRVELHPLRGSGVGVMEDDRGPEIDPDILVFCDKRVRVVVDAKFATRGSADAGDVYQVLAYARKLMAETALLIYVAAGQKTWTSRIGRADGVEVIAAGIATGQIDTEFGRLVRELGLDTPVAV